MTDDTPLWDYLATAQWNHRHARQNMNWPRVILWRRQTNYLTTRLEERE